MNYYNEHDPNTAQWLRELISAGVISKGEVDERSIEEVRPRDLRGFVQCHFFAGIGGWSYALRLAGWPDDRPVWTASLPCQPWSDAGQRLGEDDARDLWPTFRELVKKFAPPAIFGEQVASALGRLWFARIRADLETLGNEVGGADLCAAGVRAPHRRQRLYWVAYSDRHGRPAGRRNPRGQKHDAQHEPGEPGQDRRPGSSRAGKTGRVGDTEGQGRAGSEHARASGEEESGGTRLLGTGGPSPTGGMADALRAGLSPSELETFQRTRRRKQGRATGEHGGSPTVGLDDTAGDRSGSQDQTEPGSDRQDDGISRPASPWDNFELVICNDPKGPKARRVEAGTFPLDHGLPGRVGKLRGYGNAIVPIQAAEFIVACEEARVG